MWFWETKSEFSRRVSKAFNFLAISSTPNFNDNNNNNRENATIEKGLFVKNAVTMRGEQDKHFYVFYFFIHITLLLLFKI